jgi:hypothetical protein
MLWEADQNRDPSEWVLSDLPLHTVSLAPDSAKGELRSLNSSVDDFVGGLT